MNSVHFVSDVIFEGGLYASLAEGGGPRSGGRSFNRKLSFRHDCVVPPPSAREAFDTGKEFLLSYDITVFTIKSIYLHTPLKFESI